jgi:transposase
VFPTKEYERTRAEVLIETFIRKQLRLKAHAVTKVEETDECMLVHIDRLGKRLLRCGVCRERCMEVHDIRREREWRDLSMRKLPLKLRYRPRRVECPRCGVRVEDFPWAEPWARVTTALFNAVAVLARELSWQGTAREYGLNWKSVATIVKRAAQYGLKHRARPPVHAIGIDEVSRRKGQVYLTVVYDLERRVLLWVGQDRTEEAVRPFFTKEMGKRRCQTLQVVCMDMWAPYAKLVRDHAVKAQILFDRFHIVKHLNEAVDCNPPRSVAHAHFQRAGRFQGNPLAIAEESLESERWPERAAFHPGPLEHAVGPGLVPQGIVPTVLGLQAALARQATPPQVDELGHAVEAGAVQEIRAHAAHSP